MSQNGKINLTINGHAVAVPTGTNLIEAAKVAGFEIPVFCYHPKLDSVGMCRVCLVEVGAPRRTKEGQVELDAEGKPIIAMNPKLQTACTTLVAEGMTVFTESQLAAMGQSSIIEFLLTSHPLDCPVCDKGGECPLQELTLKFGPGKSRFFINEKFHFEKPVPIGPLIYLDRERCVLCARCIRFQDEIAYQPVLGFLNRGRGMEVVSFSDPPFNSKFSGNTVEICPVGALTSRDFRFQARVWELSSVGSICPHCPVGCNLTLDTRLGKIRRIVPRENDAVNEIWLCDKGRFAHHFLVSEKRVTAPLVGQNGKLVETSWDEAIKTVAQRFSQIKAKNGGLAGIGSVRTTNEENYLFQKFVRVALGTNNIDHRLEDGEDLSDLAPWAVPTGSIRDVEQADTILVIGCDPSEEVPVLELRIKKAVRRGARLLVASPYQVELAALANERLPYRPGSEAFLLAGLLAITLEEGKIQKDTKKQIGFSELAESLEAYPAQKVAGITGMAEENFHRLAEAIAESKSLVVIYGEAMAHNRAVVTALGNLALLKPGTFLFPLARGANAQGAKDMGVLPQRIGQERLADLQVKERLSGLWGGKIPEEPGLGTREILQAAAEGKITGLYIMGGDPFTHFPDRHLVERALDKVEFLVVQDLFLTETAKRADVFLPAAGFAEKDGSFTNLERRVQRLRSAVPKPSGSRTDWEIILALAKAMGQKWQYVSPQEIMAEISKAIPIYGGLDYLRLEGEGMQWPCPEKGHPGSEHLDLRPAQFLPVPELSKPASDAKHPFSLILAPRLFDHGTMVRETSLLSAFVASPTVALNPQDAAKLGIAEGEKVLLLSPQGEVELAVRLDGVPNSVALVYRNLAGPAVNLLPASDHPSTRVQIRRL